MDESSSKAVVRHSRPDVLLINPPPSLITNSDYRLQNVPLALVYVGGYARHLGFKVAIADAYNNGISMGRVVKKACLMKPAVVGITCDATRVKATLFLLKELKQFMPEALLIVGGAFPSFVPLEFFPLADVIVRGEGEASFAQAVDHFLNKKPLAEISGIYLKGKDGYVFSGERAPIECLDDYFYPAWGLVNLRHNFYFWARRYPVATLVTSRGCPEDCTYCTIPPLWGHRHRQLSVGRLIEELFLLKQKYGIREIYFKDNLFTVNKLWIRKFCEGMLQNKLQLSWSCGTGVKYVDKDVLKIMKKAGCHTINFGFESGSQKILDAMNKNVTVEENLRVAALVKKAGIRIFGFFMLGFPQETKSDMEATIDLAKKISPHTVMYSLVTPFAGTRLWHESGLDQLKNYDWEWEEHNWYQHHHSLCDMSIRELVKMKARGMRSVRTWRYWVRYILSATPQMILVQVMRSFLWRLRVRRFYQQRKNRLLRKKVNI